MNEIKGGCNCGAVRYQINRNPMTVAICHCSNCRRQSGSAFSVNVIIPAAALQISGTLTTYTDHDTDSGQPVDRQFCAQCGSPICSLSSASPQIAIIKAGTADDPARLTPAIHVWTSTALPWVNIPADLPQFARNPQ